jgi:hypothetical protein
LLDSVRLWTVSRRELGQKFLRDRLEFLFSGALEFLFSGASGLFHASLLLRFGRSKASSNYMNLFLLIALHLSSILLSYGQNTDCGEMHFHFLSSDLYDLFLVTYDEIPYGLGVDHSKSLNFRENLLGVLHWYDISGL